VHYLLVFLVGVLIPNKDCLDRQPNDAEVKPEAPVLDVPDIAFHTPLHLPQFTGLATEARHLDPTGDVTLTLSLFIIFCSISFFLLITFHFSEMSFCF
jgi:hypothetical protein